MTLKFVVISILFLVVLSESIQDKQKVDEKVINQNTKLDKQRQLKENNNNQSKESQKNILDDIVFTEVVHPQIKNVTLDLKRIESFEKQTNNKSLKKITQQSNPEINITFTELNHPLIKNVTRQTNKISDLDEQIVKLTQIQQKTNNQLKPEQQKVKKESKEQKQVSQVQPQEKQTDKIEIKQNQKQQKQVNTKQKSTVQNASHSESSSNKLNISQYQVEVQQYKRYKQFISESRFKSNSESHISSSKIKPSQQILPQKWFNSVKINETTSLVKQSPIKPKETEVQKTVNQKPKQIEKQKSQQKTKQNSQTSLRTDSKQQTTFKLHKPKQLQNISNNNQIVEEEIQTFALYKSVVLIICSILIFTLVCVKIVNCTFNNQEDPNVIKTRKDEDKQGLKFSESELMRDPDDPVGDFIQISEDDENQD